MNQSTTNSSLLRWSYLNRRRFLMAAASIPILKAQPGAPGCILTGEQEEGPYYIDSAMLRRDLTEGKPGVPLILRVTVVDATRCAPLPSAAIDIWHCDAEGVYSGFTAEGRDEFGAGRGPRGGRDYGMPPPPDRLESFAPRMPPPPPGGRGPRRMDGTRFLRGVQITNQAGVVEFATLYPGWYAGRAIHIHLKARVGGGRAGDKYAGGHVSHTGQLFFPEEISEQIAKMQPYAKHSNVPRTTEEQDGIFASQHGSSSIVRLERFGNQGFVASVTVAVDPGLTPRPVQGPPMPRE